MSLLQNSPSTLACGKAPDLSAWPKGCLEQTLSILAPLLAKCSFITCPDQWNVSKRCGLKERNVPFSFPVLLPAVWNAGLMVGAGAARIDPEVTLRVEVLQSRVARWKEVGPWSCGGSCQPLTATKGKVNFLLVEATGWLVVNCSEIYS